MLADPVYIVPHAYNAHTTACDALWAGVPLVTCLGSTFAARVGASILKAAGLPERATTSLDDDEAAAQRLAADPNLLASTRTRLAGHRLSALLFDTRQFTRHIETIYETMWERSQRGDAHESFSVAP